MRCSPKEGFRLVSTCWNFTLGRPSSGADARGVLQAEPLSPPQAARLFKYFDRGGFMMVDDFHNEGEWAIFMRGMRMIDPAVEVVELQDSDQAFHVLFDMNQRIRVPGANVVHGSGIERRGDVPHWRAVADGKGRMIVAICFNMDVGDGWEFADVPDYPEKFASEAIRLGANYVLYAMTH